jgi:predicted AlkP superfamily pyrophosphatase or phosphodiesterase
LIFALAGLSCVTQSLRDEPPPTPGDAALVSWRDGGPPQRVILITVAGLESSDFLNVWGDSARDGDLVRMPNLARLASEGAMGIRVEPPSPSSLYASHASIATGRLPAKHGIVADRALDEDGKRSLPFWDNRLLKGTAIWDAAIGRGVLSLGWPTTTGARIELLVPDGEPPDPSTSWLEYMRSVSTPMLIRELEEISEDSLAASKGETVGKRDPNSWPSEAEKDAAFIELACRVANSERDPGLWLIRLDQTASASWIAGPGSVQAQEAFERIDGAIGRLRECLEAAEQDSDTAILVTGDVTFQPVHSRVDPNVVLVSAGMVGRDPRSSTGVRSWLAFSRTNGRSAYVYARDAENALAARGLLDEESARTGAFDVVSAEALAAAGADPQAWFGLSARPGYFIGNGLVQPAVRPGERRGSHGAFPFLEPDASNIGFVAWGRGIRPQVRVPDLELVDIAPTIAALLGLRLEADLDGERLIGILRAEVPPPPPGPKRLGVGNHDGDVDRALRDLGGAREMGRDR